MEGFTEGKEVPRGGIEPPTLRFSVGWTITAARNFGGVYRSCIAAPGAAWQGQGRRLPMPDSTRHRTRVEPHPQPRYADRIRLIFERRGPGHPWIEAQVFVGGAWSPIFSLKTTCRQDALFKSVDALNEREA